MSAVADNIVLVLNPNILIARAGDYPDDVRARLGGTPDDFVVSERRSRYSAQRVSGETVRFIRRFETPIRLLDAVVAHSRDTGDDPLGLLDAVLPLVCQFQAQRILLPPEDARPTSADPKFRRGDRAAGCRVRRCVDAQTETEIYAVDTSAGAPAALKWVPPHAPDFVRSALEREEKVLRALEAAAVRSVPRVLGAGTAGEGSRYLLLSWCAGRNLYHLSRDASLDLATRARIGSKVAAIYADLHRYGMLHGDVHPGNVLADADADPVVLDFGLARRIDEDADRPRAGLLTDYEPEAARELLADRPLPASSARGEQYCVAALIFRLVTGTPCLRLSLEGRAALRQIVEQETRSFADAGIAWPALEAVLRRALAKDPAQRFPDLDTFHRALEAAVSAGPPASPSVGTSLPEVGRGGLQRILDVYGAERGLLDSGLALGPTASIYYGAAGIAYALLRASLLEEDAAALTAADAWIERAVASIPSAAAFDGPEIGIRPVDIGPAALFHTAAGVHMVRAMIRHAAGDGPGASGSVRTFLATVAAAQAAGTDTLLEARFALDMMNGPASHLLGASLLHSTCVDLDAPVRAALASAMDGLAASVRSAIARCLGPAPAPGTRYLGMAHGVGGALFALCRSAELRNQPIAESVSAALDWLAGLAIDESGGIAWPVDTTPGSSSPWTGWCHGSAGHILLWSLAARLRGRTDDRERAVGAARHLWAHRDHPNTSLCCGLAGEALSLCDVARISNDASWVDRARMLLDRAASSHAAVSAPHSLFRGHLGVMLARLELERPAQAAFPFCAAAL